jgi:predicted aconitase
VLQKAKESGFIKAIEDFGGSIVGDTCWCMLGEPIIPKTATTLMTNSAKYAHYAPGLVNRTVHFASLTSCVEAAITGMASTREPKWLN